VAALDVYDLEKVHGPDPDLRRAFEDAAGMVWLQYSLAKNAEEFERSLRRVGSVYAGDADLFSTEADSTMGVGPPRKDLAAVEELTTQARSLAGEVSQQLESFGPALQLIKAQKPHSYQLAAAELAQETANVLGRMQARAG